MVVGAVFNVICGRCSLSHACKCKPLTILCRACLEFVPDFLQKTFMSQTLHFFVIPTSYILLTVLDDVHFVCFVFCLGVTPQEEMI